MNDQWFNLKAAFNPATGLARVWINNVLVKTRQYRTPTSRWYFKNGTYNNGLSSGQRSVAHFRDIRLWRFDGSGGGDLNGHYRIMVRHSGKALAVQSASTADGANVFQWTYGGSTTNDEWQPISLGGGFYRIVNRHSGKVLEIAGSSTADGANVVQRSWANGANQQFQILPV